MKKIGIVVVVLVVIVLGYSFVKNTINLTGDTTTETPPKTTSAPTVFDTLNAQIVSINTQLITLKTNDTVTQAKIDQLILLVRALQSQIAALGK